MIASGGILFGMMGMVVAAVATVEVVVFVGFSGVELALGESVSPIEGGLYGEPGSEASEDAVLESVQLNVATPLER